MYTHDPKDWRNIGFGREIPSEMYTDQPYLIAAGDGAWLCTLTTGPNHEGKPGQHVISMRSADCGASWHDRCEIEKNSDPESAYSVLLKVPSGRIFVFYGFNEANLRWVPAADNDPPFYGKAWRVDCIGEFVFRYSDDHGRSWSARRYRIPVREMAIDRNNSTQGKVRYFWNVGRPFFRNGSCFLPMIKIGAFGRYCYNRTEGVLLQCPNIEVFDPDEFEWLTLPDGDFGIGPIEGGNPIAEEHSFVPLSDGSLCCSFRTIDGHPGNVYSRDGGHHWSASAYMRYGNGRLVKHPRAANFIWKYDEHRYLYWFHNHGGHDFTGRNPAWVLPGIEVDSPEGKVIRWGEPDILLYDGDPRIRMSYPDLLLDNGVFVTETQKRVARIHPVSEVFLETIFSQFDSTEAVADAVIFAGTDIAADAEFKLPVLAEYETGLDHPGTYKPYAGFTFELVLAPDAADGLLLDNTGGGDAGVRIELANGRIGIRLGDGGLINCWRSDEGMLKKGERNHVGIVIDGGPAIVSFVTNGVFNDGGDERQFGWGRFHPNLADVNTGLGWRVGKGVAGLRIHGRQLLTAELVRNARCQS